MVIVKKGCYYDVSGNLLDDPLDYQVVDDDNYAYNYFDTLEDVIHFRPRLSNKYDPTVPYCALRKKAFVLENNQAKHNLPHIFGSNHDHKSIVFVDNADKHKINEHFMQYANPHTYLKVNLLKSDQKKYSDFNLHPHTITPGARAVCAWLKTDNWRCPRSLKDKSYDICFVGAMRSKGRAVRREAYHQLQVATDKLGLKGLFIGSNVSEGKYMNYLNDSKICPSLKGLGYRCRREWEIMLTNSICLIDWEAKENVDIVDLEPDHFLWMKHDIKSQLKWCMDNVEKLDDMRIAAYDRSMECYIYRRLNLEERFIRLFLLKPQSVVGCYEDLLSAEEDLNLNGDSDG